MDKRAEVDFRLLEWDRGPDFHGGEANFVANGTDIRQRWFCVRAVRTRDDKPQRIADYNITVSILGVAEEDVEIDKDEGWCHYNCTFPAKCGLQSVAIYSQGHVVLERIVLFKHRHESLEWFSKDRALGCLPAAGIAKAHFSRGQDREGYADLQKFRKWAANGDWHLFGPKHNHYDWWMFPIHARASKPQYAVGPGEVADLCADEQFMAGYREGVDLMLRSWGWDLDTGTWCNPRHPCQGWRNWSVRLGKVAQSLATFGEMKLFNQVRAFLIALDVEMHAGGLALTAEGHTLPGGPITIKEQFGIDPRGILQVQGHSSLI